MLVFAKHLPYDDGHLGHVIGEMRLIGPPTIRVMRRPEGLFALEGSHRIAAAHYLGAAPRFVGMIADFSDDGHWQSIIQRLPVYRFTDWLYLDLSTLYAQH